MLAPQRASRRPAAPKKLGVPIAGWISNRALSSPYGTDGGAATGAMVLDNFVPRAETITMRAGKLRYATLGGDGRPADSLFSHVDGANRKLFAASDTTIYDITTVDNANNLYLIDEHGDYLVNEDGLILGYESTVDLAVMGGFSGGNWITTQFGVTGGTYTLGVNGVNTGFIFDGTDFYPMVNGGTWRLELANITAPFADGELITGQTSGATAQVWKVRTNELLITGLSSQPFIDDEDIVGSLSGVSEMAGVPTMACPSPTFSGGRTSADMSFVAVYRNRLYFAETGTMNAWYMDDVDAIGGEASMFPLNGVFDLGGELLIIQRWSLSSGGDGGLSEQCVFISTEGQVAVYQGGGPADIGPEFSSEWAIQGLYRIGRPLGNRAFIRGAGDLAIATTVGLVPLSKAMELDLTALTVASISAPISDAWTRAVLENAGGMGRWQGEIWAEQEIAVFGPPLGSEAPFLFVSSTKTGAWSRFTGWEGRCFEVFNGKLYFGETNGGIFIANESGSDDGAPYTARMLPLYDDMGTPGNLKIGKVGRYLMRAVSKIDGQTTLMTNYSTGMPVSPAAEVGDGNGAIWGVSEWGDGSVWGGNAPNVFIDKWASLGGSGYALSLAYQVTSSGNIPLGLEVISGEIVFDVSGLVS